MNEFSKNSRFLYAMEKDYNFNINSNEISIINSDKVIKVLDDKNVVCYIPISDYVFLADAKNDHHRKAVCKNLDKVFRVDTFKLFNKVHDLLKNVDLEEFLKGE